MIAALTLLAACSDPPLVEKEGVRLDPVGHLVRASMTIRGIRPSIAEIDAVRADPAALESLVDTWLESDEFGETIRDMWAEILLLRDDTFNQLPALGLLTGENLEHIFRGTTEEPLMLVEHIVMNDLPLTDIVTAEYMLTDDITARIYGVPYDFTLGGWQLSAWADDRPKAGLLSSAQVWRRWESNGSNYNRGRASMIAGKLLCEPFETRDIFIPGGINIASDEEVANALVDNAACVSCHQALDPIAGYLWGYKKLIHRNYVADSITGGCEWNWDEIGPEFGPSYLPEDYCYPIKQYNPADEDDWQVYGLRTPSYYGTDVGDARGLGLAIAEDPRFSSCMSRSFYGYLTEVDTFSVPFDVAAELQEQLEGSNFNAKALVKSIVLDPDFALVASAPGVEDPAAKLRTIRPEQYARTVLDLTGFSWMSAADPPNCDNNSNTDRFGPECWGNVDLANSDVYGFRSMAGGVDGKVILTPIHTVTPTKSLVMSHLAANAAGFVVANDFALAADQRKLLGLVEASTTDETKIREQIVWLHERILAETVGSDSARVDDLVELFDIGVAEQGSPAGGWRVVVSAMLQDPAMLFF
jgi:hypothetical protein